MNESTFPDGTAVRHLETRRQGSITGTTTENGSTKYVVAWKNGQKSHVKGENLEAID